MAGSGYNLGGAPTGYHQGRMQNFTPQQMKLFSQMFGQLGPDSFLAKLAGGDQSMFEQMEKPAWQQFQQAQGQLANRFSGMGMGARMGSGFKNTMNQAASDFASNLASQRMNLQRQALSDMMGMSNALLNQRPFENYLVKEQHNPSIWESLAPLAGSAVGAYFGGPAGAQMGYQAGTQFGQHLTR